MQVKELYGFVVLLVLIGMVLGVGILTLDNFQTSTGITGGAADVIGNTSSAIAPISTTWLPLVVTIVVLAIIFSIVLSAFGGRGR